MNRFTFFETAIGWAGLIWGDGGLVGVHLPERDVQAARRSLRRRFREVIETAAPGDLAPVIDGIGALMRGEKADLSGVVLDLTRVPAFNARV